MRLIDADELKKYAIPCVTHNGALTELCISLYQIDNAPTVEYPFYQEAYQTGYEEGKNERPQGEWIESNFTSELTCPICREVLKRNYFNNFCSNCGADMRGKGV